MKTITVCHVQSIHPITHLAPQTAASLFESQALSQYRVAEIILKQLAINPHTIVIQESQYDDFTPDYYHSCELARIAAEIFPNNELPRSFDKCTALQKEFIYNERGTRTLFYLGKLKCVYKAIHYNEAVKIDNTVKTKGFAKSLPLIYKKRELEALQRTVDAARLQNSAEVNALLIFGKRHDFQQRINHFKAKNSALKIVYGGALDAT